MKKKIVEPTLLIDLWKQFLGPWGEPQRNLRLVTRWGRHRSPSITDRIASNPLWQDMCRLGESLRILAGIPRPSRQDTLMHTHGILTLAHYVLHELRPVLKLDEPLILMAVHYHDEGEGQIGKDTVATEKQVSHDLAEYEAFDRLCRGYSHSYAEACKRAFLLQFADKNPGCFPDDARAIMRELAETRLREALVFKACENMDYFLYELQEHLAGRHQRILREIGNSLPALDDCAARLPEFADRFWPPAVRANAIAFLESCKP